MKQSVLPPAPGKAADAAAAGDATAPAPAVSVKGGVMVFRAKAGDWAAHVAMVKQAARLAYLAQSRGAVVRRCSFTP